MELMESENSPTSGISVTPAFFIRTIEKGIPQEFEMTIRNNNEFPIQITSSAGEFEQNPENLTNYISNISKYSRWFNSLDITIEEKSEETVTFTLDIPENRSLTSATYYPALILGIHTQPETSTPSATIEHAIPLYLIANEAEPKLNVSEYAAAQKYSTSHEIKITTKIANEGDTFVRPAAYHEFFQLGILDKEKRTRIETIPVNTRQIIILPGSVLSEESTWTRNIPGHYESILHLVVDNTEVGTQSLEFWIIPGQWAIAFGVIIAICICLFSAIITKNRHKLVAKAKLIFRFRSK